ncbi:MAG TPA: HAMP domain-containing sensor histidine kinase [Actinomycetota bacterium]
MFRSLRVRIAASHASVLAVILLALGGAGLLLLSRDLDREATAQLVAVARQQVNRIEELGRPVPPPDSDVPSASATQIAVFTPGRVPVGESTEVPAWLTPGASRLRDLTVRGERVRVVTLTAGSRSSPLGLVVAGRSLEPEEHLLHRVRLLLLVGGLVAVGLSMAAGWWLAGRAVRPVQAAYEAQAGFAADASHELRTPLTFIRSGVEVLAERDPDLGQQVLSEIDYLTGLTRRLLDLARAEGGTLVLERAPLDVDEVCRSAARRSRAASGTHLTLEGSVLPAIGDRVALEAALDAVLENVGVHGGKKATMRWEMTDDRAVVSVADRGPGLPPTLTARAFERFARADPSRTRSTGGAGLGLAVALALIEAQGGRMWLEPTPGGGLTAKIALPIA